MVPEKQNKTEDTNKLTLLAFKIIAGARSEEYGGLLSVSPPEEHHERRTFCRRGGNPRTCDSVSAIDS
jgi:hypothetical protein